MCSTGWEAARECARGRVVGAPVVLPVFSVVDASGAPVSAPAVLAGGLGGRGSMRRMSARELLDLSVPASLGLGACFVEACLGWERILEVVGTPPKVRMAPPTAPAYISPPGWKDFGMSAVGVWGDLGAVDLRAEEAVLELSKLGRIGEQASIDCDRCNEEADEEDGEEEDERGEGRSRLRKRRSREVMLPIKSGSCLTLSLLPSPLLLLLPQILFLLFSSSSLLPKSRGGRRYG
jgi:hypothetical protein